MTPSEAEFELVVEPVPPELLGRIKEGLFAFNYPPDSDSPDDSLETVLSYSSRPRGPQGHATQPVVQFRDAAYNLLGWLAFEWTDHWTWDPTCPEFTLERRPRQGKPPEEPSVRWTPSEGLVPWSGVPAPSEDAVTSLDKHRVVPSGLPELCWRSSLYSSLLELITWPGCEVRASLDLSPWAPEPRQWATVAFPLPELRALLLYWGSLRHPPRVRDQPKLCFLVRVHADSVASSAESI